MSDVFFESLNIPKPDYNLSINNLSHGAMTGRMIEQIENIFTSNMIMLFYMEILILL